MVYDAIWSPDGRRILVTGDAGAAVIDLSLPFERRRPQPLPNAERDGQNFTPISWSPDGRWLAGEVQTRSARLGLALYSFETARYEKLQDSGMLPIWLRDGRLLYLDGGKLFLLDPATRRGSEVLAPPANTNSIFKMVAVSPDNRTLFFVRASDEGDIKLLRMQ
jgi:Tol biopolymer transport system component